MKIGLGLHNNEPSMPIAFGLNNTVQERRMNSDFSAPTAALCGPVGDQFQTRQLAQQPPYCAQRDTPSPCREARQYLRQTHPVIADAGELDAQQLQDGVKHRQRAAPQPKFGGTLTDPLLHERSVSEQHARPIAEGLPIGLRILQIVLLCRLIGISVVNYGP